MRRILVVEFKIGEEERRALNEVLDIGRSEALGLE